MVDQVRVGIDGQCSVPPGGTCDSNPDQAACVNKDRIDYLTVDASLSFGPVFARHLGHRMYRGEYFAMQTDVHARVLNSFFVCEKNDAEVSSAGSHMGESIF